MRAVEYFGESVTSDAEEKFFEILGVTPPALTFDAVRCSRWAEFNFFIDKVKIGPLQCMKNDNLKVRMGIQATSAIPEGNYYLTTNSDCLPFYGYSLAANGILPYLEGIAPSEINSFQ